MTEPKKSHPFLGRKPIQASSVPRDLMAERLSTDKIWTAQIITLLPNAFPGVLGESLTGRALEKNQWQLDLINLRQFGDGKHRNVDDRPAGGGAGMVLRPDVMGDAVETALAKQQSDLKRVYLSPRGKPFDQQMAVEWSESPGVLMICGRFEGLDQRVIDHYAFEEVSLGDFVMTGGEIAAQAMIDATIRLLPGVLGNSESIQNESHSDGLLEHSQYTRPTTWKGRSIPDVLLSGHHSNIETWRQTDAERLTKLRRPDLLERRKDDD